MKKRMLIFLMFLFAASQVFAVGKYGGITESSYWGIGWAGAKYCGTTKNLTIEEVHNDRWNNAVNGTIAFNIHLLSGKLSRRQSSLLWYALGQYDYEAGEIYAVSFAEEAAPNHHFALTVQIKADGSCTWLGFTYDI